MINSQSEGLTHESTSLNTLLQSLLEGIIIQDIDGNIIEYNQSALDILGLTKEQLKERANFKSSENNLAEWEKNFPGKKHIGMN